ncbi:glycosyltransferase [Parabacteroides sp.]
MIKKKSILFCIDSLDGGGAEHLLIEILKRFDYELYDVSLLILFDRGVYRNDIPYEVDWLAGLKDKNHPLRRKQYDIEIAFLEGVAVKYVAYRNSNALKIAWIHTDLYKLHWCKQFYRSEKEEKRCFSAMDKLVFVSTYTKKQFQKLYSDIQAEHCVLPNLIDRDSICRLAEACVHVKEKLTICCVGRLNPEKGYMYLLQVVEKLVSEGLDFQLWILGEGYLRESLLQYICEHQLDHYVYLKGFLKNPYSYMKTADVFVSASRVEGAPLVISEALCLRRPVLATRSGGADEILEGGKYGILVDSDQESIYTGLKQLILNRSLRNELSVLAGIKAMSFEPAKTMSQLYKILIP